MNVNFGDYGVVTEPGTVRVERLLPGPIERLWSYLTDSDKRRLWLASGAFDLRVGGETNLEFRNSDLSGPDDLPPEKYAAQGEALVRGRITVCEPPRRLGYSFAADSEVLFELTPKADKILLVVTHSRIPSHAMMTSVSAGWHTHLDILVARLEGREPESFWAKHTRLEAEYDQRLQARSSS